MYSEMIDKSIEKVYQAGVATKILQYMGKIRNESDITQARRWVMELLQNARDLAFPDRPVDVQFVLEEDTLVFRHTGKPFRVKDILSIINQVSSKNPGEGVGQFGTGFMTTYQLSEKVEIHSVLQEDGCPAREFRITLDRSGNTKEEILQAIEKSLEELRQADEGPEAVDGDRERRYDTEFCYRLGSENGCRIARTGMTDLADTILYIMLFSDRIGSVELLYRLPDRQQSILYKRVEYKELPNGIGELVLLEIESPGKTKQHTICCMSEAGLTLAAEYDEKVGFLPASERVPKLFVDFPLIGAEQFPFPVILNHLGLHTNEPRSGISLVDNNESLDARINKEIMLQAVALYGRFVKALLDKDSRGIENLIQISEWKENKEWSEGWVRQYLYQDIYRIVRELPILPTEEGRIPLADPECYLIQSADNEEAGRIRRLLAPLKGYQVIEDETDWYSVFYAYGVSEEKVISLEKIMAKAAEHLRQDLDEEKMEAVEWCNLLYQSGMQNPDIAIRIQSGNVAIFPNQNAEDWKERRLFNILQIYQDPGIPEVLKDVAEKLALLDDSCQGGADSGVRRRLLHQSFLLGDNSAMSQYELTTITEYILARSNRGYRVQNFTFYRERYLTAWREAWYLMLACGPDEEMYRLCRMVWKDKIPRQQKINDTRFQSSLWNNSYRSVLLEMIEWLEGQPDRDALQNSLWETGEYSDLYWWLNCCYDRINWYLRSNEYWYQKILLNQKGELKCPADLKQDRIREEELKEISSCFRGLEGDCDVCEVLLDKEVSLNGWNLPVFNDNDVTMRINRALQKLLSEMNLSQADMVYQEACSRLLAWIQEHPDLAKDTFPNYCKEEDQMKLLTPGAAVNLQRKAKKLDDLYEELGTEDPEELVRLIKKAKTMDDWKVEGEMWADEEMDGLSDEERKDALREIGLAGEEYVYKTVCDYFVAEGYEIQSEEEGEVLLSLPGSQEGPDVKILRPDNESYHQPGWDISVFLSSASAGQGDRYYLEVKTHTSRSVSRGILALSNEQMKLAADQGEHYVLFSVVYDYRNKSVVSMHSYQDLIRCMADGSLYNTEGKYLMGVYGTL